MTAQQPPYVLAAGSIQHDAEQFRRLIQSLAAPTAGVLASADCAVTQRAAGANMSVDVAGGRVFILGTEATYQGTYWAENRGIRNVTIAAADATNPRRDIIVARVRDAAYSGASNDWDIIAVTGTPAASPTDPTLPANSVSLARVAVAAAAASITNANITDLRVAQNRIGCEVYNTVVTSLIGGAITPIPMNTETYDPLGYHSTSSNTNRLTIPTGLDGVYSVVGHFHESTSPSNAQIGIQKNGNVVSRKGFFGGGAFPDQLAWVGYLAAGDWVGLSYYHGGATHNDLVQAASADGPFYPSLLAYKVG